MAAKREAKKKVKSAPKAKAKTKAKRKKAAKKRAAPKKAAKKRAAPPKTAKKKAAAKSNSPKKAAPKRAAKKRAPSRAGKRTKRAVLKGPVIAQPAKPAGQPKPVSAPPEVQVEPAAAKARTPSTPPSVKEAVDAYMEGLPHGALAGQLRKILTNAASGVDEAIKWAHADYQDPNGILHGATEKVRQVKRLIKPD